MNADTNGYNKMEGKNGGRGKSQSKWERVGQRRHADLDVHGHVA